LKVVNGDIGYVGGKEALRKPSGNSDSAEKPLRISVAYRTQADGDRLGEDNAMQKGCQDRNPDDSGPVDRAL
jgi:hypothetical protein